MSKFVQSFNKMKQQQNRNEMYNKNGTKMEQKQRRRLICKRKQINLLFEVGTRAELRVLLGTVVVVVGIDSVR